MNNNPRIIRKSRCFFTAPGRYNVLNRYNPGSTEAVYQELKIFCEFGQELAKKLTVFLSPCH